ncbi:hypothetical protein [Streptomyces sp. NBC_01116]|uniref:mycothiol-dependent nitroreductase Rv2466c family protein n=1 Tax=Streptomyces sp. NBC_01116 TaxID=2903752 RepID=UPI00352F1465
MPTRSTRLRAPATGPARKCPGQEAGAPVVAVNGVGLFGPVLTAVPRGEEANRLFQAPRTLAGMGAFAGPKRGRGALDFH